MKKKTVKEVKMHKLLVCACKFQDFTQSQTKVARLHDCDFKKLCVKCQLSHPNLQNTFTYKPLEQGS